ncbi:MAG TPA: carbohydrate binding domain-containing protein [Candidatus Sulfotelmatobacter sp.]
MTPPLRPIIRNVSLVLICVGIVWIYIARVVRVYLAQRSASSSQIEGAEHAIRLAPGNAEFHELLGLQLSASDQDYDRAATSLRNAVALNPNRARYWLDLASVYQVTDNIEKQNDAVKSALGAEPNDPEVAAEAGLFFLVAGDANRALPLFHLALAQNPDAATSILPACWREMRDASLILAKVIPDNPELQLQFLALLTQQKEPAAAQQVWQYLMASHRPFQPQLSFFYFDYLLNNRDVAGFAKDWRELAGVTPNLQAYLPNDNLMVNGSFEQPLLNSGFDWRREAINHISAGIDASVAHSGTHSLSLSYDGNSAYDAGWKQFVPVKPNSEYEFSVWIKSENVTSSSGPRVAIADAYSGTNLALTDDVLDTHPWQEMKTTLHVPANTELIAVKIVRTPAEPRIQGQVWIDDLRLVKR